MVWLSQKTVDGLRATFCGTVIVPDDPSYDAARKVYNAMIDRRPAVIVRCVNATDVQTAVNWARDFNLPLAVRGGGHSGAGLGACDDGFVLDLSLMRDIRVDPQKRTIRVEGGCALRDIDQAAYPFGLAVPSGTTSSTGIGGLALGGGIGHLTRKYGLTIDSLLSVEMVLADGSMITASAGQNEDLFWAVRGGGGNFGVVTAFVFKLYPVSTVIAGSVVWSLDMAAEVMRFYRDFMLRAPEDLSGIFAVHTVPPGPPFPEHLHLRKVCGVTWCYTGPDDEAEKIFQPIKNFGPPAFYGVKPTPFPILQSAIDVLYPPGLQWYWKADFIEELTDEAIHLHVKHASILPTPHSRTQLFPIDGAAGRIGKYDTAFSYRDAHWAHVIVGVDPNPANAALLKSWSNDYWEALHPYSAGGAYINFMMNEDANRIKAGYRENHTRLSGIKKRFDPNNLFHHNQNIQPVSE